MSKIIGKKIVKGNGSKQLSLGSQIVIYRTENQLLLLKMHVKYCKSKYISLKKIKIK